MGDPPSEGNRDVTCIICLDDFQYGDPLVHLACLHAFHQQCLEHWEVTMVRARHEEDRVVEYSCPLCRGPPDIVDRTHFGIHQTDFHSASGGDGASQASNRSHWSNVFAAWPEAFHATTQLADGRISWIIDPGAWTNLIGKDLARRAAKSAIEGGYPPTQERLQTPISVAGVGKGSQTCTWKLKLPIAVDTDAGDTQLHSITAPIVEGDGSHLPGLLGLESLERNRAILDTGRRQLIFPGPGEIQVVYPPGTTILPLEKAPSGHLVLVTDAYGQVIQRVGVKDSELMLHADLQTPLDIVAESSSIGAVADPPVSGIPPAPN